MVLFTAELEHQQSEGQPQPDRHRASAGAGYSRRRQGHLCARHGVEQDILATCYRCPRPRHRLCRYSRRTAVQATGVYGPLGYLGVRLCHPCCIFGPCFCSRRNAHRGHEQQGYYDDHHLRHRGRLCGQVQGAVPRRYGGGQDWQRPAFFYHRCLQIRCVLRDLRRSQQIRSASELYVRHRPHRYHAAVHIQQLQRR